MYQGTITQLLKTHSKQMTFIMPNRWTNWNRNHYVNILIQQKENHIQPNSPNLTPQEYSPPTKLIPT